MLRWAVRYFVIAIAAAVLFAALQGREWATLGPAGRDGVGAARGQPASHPRPARDYGAEGNQSDYSDDGDGGDYDYGDDGDDGDDGDHSNLEQIIDAGPHGHFLVEAVVNGVPIGFMVDTGASHVVLALQDARKLGFTPASLQFTQEFRTANGTVRAAPVELRELRIGQLRLFDLEASVNGGSLPISLLGMSFLQRLSGYEVARGRLVLRW